MGHARTPAPISKRMGPTNPENPHPEQLGEASIGVNVNDTSREKLWVAATIETKLK